MSSVILSNSECSTVGLLELVTCILDMALIYQYLSVMCTFASSSTEALNLYLYFTQLTIENEHLIWLHLILQDFHFLSSVHGFEMSMVLVTEGDPQVTLNIRLDIKGNTLDEPAQFQVTRINFTVVCEDVTTGG